MNLYFVERNKYLFVDIIWNFILFCIKVINEINTYDTTHRTGRENLTPTFYGGEDATKIFLVSIIFWRFISSELKTQVSFSDPLSYVRMSHVCKLFTFSSSSPEPLDQVQPNVAHNILVLRTFQFGQMKLHALLQGKIIG